MLINVRVSELLTDTSNSIPLTIIISISFYYSVHPIIPYSIAPFTSYIFYLFKNLNFTSYLNYSDDFNDLFKLSDTESDNGMISFVTSYI